MQRNPLTHIATARFITIACIIAAVIAAVVGPVYAQYRQSTLAAPPPPPVPVNPLEAAADTAMMPFPVGYTVPPDVDYLIGEQMAVDLQTPSNITTDYEYDPATGCYVVRTKVGEMEIMTPFLLTPGQFNDWQTRQSMLDYYRRRNAESLEQSMKEPFNIFDMNFALGPLEKIFGPGGVNLRLQGSMQIKMGINSNFTNNPALSEEARRRTSFDFDQKIQATVNASVGNRLKFNMTYNTDATFEFDSKNLKLAYEGEEDDIVKSIEAGNVSMTTGSSLIRGATALFGLKTQLQFGKLTATALVSQQNSQSVSVSSQGGVQTTDFDINVHDYDANRHYFLAHYFYDNYDTFASRLPYINSGIEISNVEVWVTNSNTNFNQSRDVIAFMDLAEGEAASLQNSRWTTASTPVPNNGSNDLYSTITALPGMASINTVESTLSGMGLESGVDYAKVENARLLSSSEYTLNSKLGYISLRTALRDEVLGVAFQYTYQGKVYTVGQLSSQVSETGKPLVVKLLKTNQSTPELKNWKLMMRNVYSLGAYSLERTNFKLDIKYLNSAQGNVLQNYLPASGMTDRTLLQVMGLDRLDTNLEGSADGFFDYIEGYTVNSQLGKIIFPVTEPFGEYLAQRIRALSPGTDPDDYCYYDLYTSLPSECTESRNANLYSMSGHYQASSGATIRLNAANVPRGSVVVTAGGQTLTENTDYTVDYSMGIVTITNQSIIDSGQSVNVTLENQNLFSMQRKTLLGLDLSYKFNKDFSIGATVMHYSEKALTEKVNIGNEVVNNTIWGLNFAYNTNFNWLTNLLNKIPTVNATQPSSFNIQGEFAQLVPHNATSGSNKGSSYIDDFESTLYGIDLRSPSAWQLCSSPFPNAMGSAYGLTGDLESGKRRALLNWYYIDQLFTSQNSNSAPPGVRGNREMLSNPYIREVRVEEVFPGRTLTYGESNVIQTLNLTYYPGERGPYNVNPDFYPAEAVTPAFKQGNWGGIMRKMETTDFEASNVEYLQFWLMDPYMDWKGDGTEIPSGGGKVVIQFGDISEDILRDGRKSYENGVPVDNNAALMDSTVWGRVARNASLSYAFDNNTTARRVQDVGIDGLSDEMERTFPTYAGFVDQVLTKTGSVPQDVLVDPAADDYHYFLGSDYDEQGLGVLERYKKYNGLEGNSLPPEDASYSGYQSSRNTPDVEDINQDNTLNESDNYFEYTIQFPEGKRSMEVGDCDGFLTEVNETQVLTQDGKMQAVKWYHFKVPLSEYTAQKGTIKNFSSIRFMRMYLTNFDAITHLRFAELELMRGEWRPYKYRLDTPGSVPAEGQMSSSVVNIEENSTKRPVNYVLPPGVTRQIDPGQNNATQLNEQSLALTVRELPAGAERAIYRPSSLDLRNYKRLQMWVHEEALENSQTVLGNGDLSLFIRLGTDAKNNYYEYELPLSVTPPGVYSNESSTDRERVWPLSNYLDLELQRLVDLKRERNREKTAGQAGVAYNTVYHKMDDEKPGAIMRVLGNPSLSNVKTMLVGIRNNTQRTLEGTVWLNELRVTDFENDGGWAAKVNANLGISDVAQVNFAGHIETDGFGSVDQSLNNRRMDKYENYNVAVQADLGRFVPEKAKLKAPVYYSYATEKNTPKYNPLDPDVLLSDAIDDAQSEAEKQNIKDYSITRTVNQNFSVSGLRFERQAQTPKPWDPANFTVNFSFSKKDFRDPTTDHEYDNHYSGALLYSYTPYVKGWKPFSFIKSKNRNLRFIKEWELNYLPANIALFNTITRDYFETQARADYELGDAMQTQQLPVSARKEFYWDRQFQLSWNLTKSLSFNIDTNTKARIEETMGAVNRKLFPDRYKEWRDTVWHSLLRMGTPWNYNQNFTATYKAPFTRIPVLDWLTADVNYASNYTWERGATVEGISVGNNIANRGAWGANGRINLETIFNKFAYTKQINQRFANSRNKPPERKPRKYERTFALKPDTVLTIRHNLRTKKVNVVATTPEGEPFEIRTKVVDANTVNVLTHGNKSLKFTVTEIIKEDKTFWTEALAYSTRLLMSPRNISVKWRRTNTSNIPLFIPNAGDIFGQNLTYGPMAPGMAFAFGFTGTDYLDKAKANGWLMTDGGQTSPAVFNTTDEFNVELNLELFKGFKVQLTGNRTDNRTSSVQFMYDNQPTTYSGSYTKTHVAIATALRSFSDKNNYHSDAFEKFCDNIPVIKRRFDSQFAGMTYPATGFFGDEATRFAGQPFNPENGASSTSSDVLIPAFLAAYTGRDPEKQYLDVFPGLGAILPNWRVTYDGFVNMGNMRQWFKTFTLTHAYQCTYSVGSYTSHLTYVGMDGSKRGFIYDEINGAPLPSSAYNISSVAITERFAPLIGLSVTMNNDINVNAEWRDQRTLTLNTSAGQVVEATSKGLTVGAGYVIKNFNTVLKMRGSQTGVSNDLTLQADVSWQVTQALIRNIANRYTQATNGTSTIGINITANYVMSRLITLGAFFDHQINTPIVTNSSFPTTNSQYGLSLNITLAQ